MKPDVATQAGKASCDNVRNEELPWPQGNRLREFFGDIKTEVVSLSTLLQPAMTHLHFLDC